MSKKKRKNKAKYPEDVAPKPEPTQATWGYSTESNAFPTSMYEILSGRSLRPRLSTDCARELYEDREATVGYLHNAYTSTHHDVDNQRWFSGFVVSVVDHDDLGSAYEGKAGAPPISIAVTHNVTGERRVCVAYFSTEEAKQIVNQLSHAIGQAESATEIADANTR